MAQMKSVRTVVSLAAGNSHKLKNFDIRQAFTFAEAIKPVYMYLPDLDTMGITNPLCGRSKRSGYVAKTKRMLYGQCDAGRAWMNLLDKFFCDIGATPTISDRMCYTWKNCRFAVHVDDILGSFSTTDLEDEFEALLRQRFGHDKIEVDNGSWILGIKVVQDIDGKKIHMSQGDFARKLLDTFDVPHDVKPEATPLPVNAEFRKFDGVASAHEAYNMMMLAGSLQWLQCCTRLDLSHAAGMIARYASNPSPQHIEYGYHVLRYIAGSIDTGITYHGCDDVVNVAIPEIGAVYPLRNKLWGMVDSDLGGCKDTEKSTSGLILMLNGGPVVWRSTRQTTASTGTTEAESKAATFIGQHTHWHKDFLSELGFPQPPVRLLEDNKGVVDLSYGTTAGKSGHFRRSVAYYEGLVNRGVCWFDKVPSGENGADVLTKCVPSTVLHDLVSVNMGIRPKICLTRRLRDILRYGHVR